jgi:group I intron endonuclease
VGHVYQFRNLVNGKVYVGISDREVSLRKKENFYDLRHDEHHNQYLQNAWNKYGEENFVWELIEYTDNPEHTHEREFYWVEYYAKTLGAENVYNIKPIERSAFGRKKKPWTEEHRANFVAAQKKRFENPAEKEKNRQAAVIGHQKRKESGYKLVQSEVTKQKISERAKERFASGFKIERGPITDEQKAAISKAQSKVWEGFISPEGIEFRLIENLREFCKQHDLVLTCMRDLAYGKIINHKGWTHKDYKPPIPKIYGSVVSPDGKVYRAITNVTHFAKEHGLSPQGLSQLLKGSIPHTKGWKRLDE